MKLAFSPASPYVRKVTACAIKRDLNVERLKIGTTDPELLKFNPLSKVPTLITDHADLSGSHEQWDLRHTVLANITAVHRILFGMPDRN